MYGVRSDPILRALEGVLLLQICFGMNETIFRFDNEVTMTLMVDVAIEAHGFRPLNPLLISEFLVSLLGKRVDRVTVLNVKTLEIAFEGKSAIRVDDESENYESIVISTTGSILVV